jgi:peptidoglycan/xylan/chitin deacetylase (PgdA/CDA1 family)
MVSNEPNGFYPEISTYNFEKQMRHIANNYNVMSLDEIVQRVSKKESIRGCVAITFDDGFRDNYDNAYPILKKYDLPATIFLTTGYIGTGIVPWFIKERYIFMKTKKTQLRFSSCDKQFFISMPTIRDRFLASDKLMIYLKNCSKSQRNIMLNQLCEKFEVNDFQDIDSIMLNWEQVREMSQDRINFGAHTVSHPVLSKVNPDIAKKEIFESKETILKKTGNPVNCFAYPFGKKADYNSEIFEILKNIGFQCGVTSEKEFNSYETGLYELNRNTPWELTIIR